MKAMKAIYTDKFNINTSFKVEILQFINDGFAIIKKQHGHLDRVYVDQLRLIDEGGNNDR